MRKDCKMHKVGGAWMLGHFHFYLFSLSHDLDPSQQRKLPYTHQETFSSFWFAKVTVKCP